MKIALAKLHLHPGLSEGEVFAAVQSVSSHGGEVSPIPPLEGKDAFRAQERRMVADMPVVARKAQLVARRFRDAVRIIKTPIEELR